MQERAFADRGALDDQKQNLESELAGKKAVQAGLETDKAGVDAKLNNLEARLPSLKTRMDALDSAGADSAFAEDFRSMDDTELLQLTKGDQGAADYLKGIKGLDDEGIERERESLQAEIDQTGKSADGLRDQSNDLAAKINSGAADIEAIERELDTVNEALSADEVCAAPCSNDPLGSRAHLSMGVALPALTWSSRCIPSVDTGGIKQRTRGQRQQL